MHDLTNNDAAQVSHLAMLVLVCRLLQVIDEEDPTVVMSLVDTDNACQSSGPINVHVESSLERRLKKREGLVDLEIVVGSLA